MGYSMSLIGPSRHAALRSPTVAFGCTLDMAGPAAGLSRSRMTRRRHGHRVSSEPSLVHSLEPYCASRPLLAKVQYRGRLSIWKPGFTPHEQLGVWASRSARRLLAPANCYCSGARRCRASPAYRARRILFGGECRPKQPSFRTVLARCQRCDVAGQISRPFRLHSLHLLLCRSAPCGDRHRALSLPSRQSRDGGRAVARRQLRRGAANPLHHRKPAGPTARRLMARRPAAYRIGR